MRLSASSLPLSLSLALYVMPGVGHFAGNRAACQIGAKSELSGDYSAALLTAGGTEGASITPERLV